MYGGGLFAVLHVGYWIGTSILPENALAFLLPLQRTALRLPSLCLGFLYNCFWV